MRLPVKSDDGSDRLFGDDGNDWLVGGTNCDWLFGGFGDDLLNLDDFLDTAGGTNKVIEPDARFRDADFAFGGAGRDVLIANTAADRMFDWGGEFNSFIVPFSRFGPPTVNRSFAPAVRDLIRDLAYAAGTDSVLTPSEPFDEVSIVEPADGQLWNDQHGGPRDPQPGNVPGSQADSSGGPELHCPCATTAELEVSKYLWTEDGTLQRVGPTVVPVITPGTLVYWTYELRNLSRVVVAGTDLAMLVTSLVDDAGTPYDPLDDFVPVYVSGDTDRDGLLDVGEIWVFTSRGVITYRVVPGPYTNTVTAQGAAADGCCGVATAFSSHVGTVVVTPPDPAVVQVVKLVNGSDANDAPGVAVTAGSTVTWTYRVSNTGQSPATGVGLVDDNGTPNNPADDFVPTYLSGDLNGNGLLDVGETWLYTASGVAISGLYCNTATVSATGVASDTDPACYTGGVVPLPPVVKVVKLVNGQDANTAPGVAVTTGSTVTWTYQVTNTGGSPASGVALVDDNGTSNNSADDFSPTYVSGDSNNNGLLDVGETWLYTASGTAMTGPYCNVATVSATGVASGTDPACYTGGVVPLPPVVKVVKLVNGQDANTAPGVAVTTGSTVTWTYQVTNTGGSPASGVTLVDDNGTPNNARTTSARPTSPVTPNDNGLLDVGETVAVHGIRDCGDRAVLQRRDRQRDGRGQRAPTRLATPAASSRCRRWSRSSSWSTARTPTPPPVSR